MTNIPRNSELLRECWLLFMQSANDSLSLYDSELNLIEINEAGLRMFPEGTTKEDVMGKNLSILVSDVIERGNDHRFKKVFETGEPIFLKDLIPPDKFGEDRHFELKVLKVGDYLGIIAKDITDFKRTDNVLQKRETDLEAKTKILEDLNTTLKVLLKQREADREELERIFLLNVKELILPYLEKLRHSELTESQKTYLGVLEENLRDIISPFTQRLNIQFSHLTPSEIMVANLIKQGRTSKEIANISNSSLRAIEFHRSNLRKKLGIQNHKTNLRTYLLSLE